MKLPNSIADFLKLEPRYFVVILLHFWLKLKQRKNRNLYYVLIVFNNQMYFNRKPVVSGAF